MGGAKPVEPRALMPISSKEMGLYQCPQGVRGVGGDTIPLVHQDAGTATADIAIVQAVPGFNPNVRKLLGNPRDNLP
ncbi:hypothetical protein GCM10025857_17430 [Alicyclobacillus contaminans]|nr:hypothetical protein GCM10025857_17430 [Alicyclobacillus contaminans]